MYVDENSFLFRKPERPQHLERQIEMVKTLVFERDASALDGPLSEKEAWANKHPGAKVFTISAHEEEGSQYSEVQVPMQRTYVGHQAIPSSTASLLCADLGLSAILQELNSIFNSPRTLDEPEVVKALQMCIDRGYDFGMAYGFLRGQWDYPESTFVKNLDQRRDDFIEDRRKALSSNGYIANPNLRPNRLWDLYSNRVLPSWATLSQWRHGWSYRHVNSISHAWMEEAKRQYVETPINGREWPVPIPKDTTLERIRIELLNYGFEYVWLDVLCLRQRGSPEKEPLRFDEWRLDVPTIGAVYHIHSKMFTFCYFSGLGRPFEIGDLASNRHWLNRAWTLQETKYVNIPGGIVARSPSRNWEGQYDDDATTEFFKRVDEIRTIMPKLRKIHENRPPDPCQILGLMRYRVAESELDKIFGLACLLHLPTLPTYIAGQDPEIAWVRLVSTMQAETRGEILMRTPGGGNGTLKWCPSWEQIKDTIFLAAVEWGECVLEYQEEEEVYYHEGYQIDECRLDSENNVLEFDLKDQSFRYEFFSYGPTPVPSGCYTLTTYDIGSQYFVVSNVDSKGRLEKVGLIGCDMLKDFMYITMSDLLLKDDPILYK